MLIQATQVGLKQRLSFQYGSEAHIVFNFDAGTVDKYITGGVYDIKPVGEADYQDTFSGAIEGVMLVAAVLILFMVRQLMVNQP